jgi:hypothetical protein
MELWMKFREIREKDWRKLYQGGDLKWRIRPGSADEKALRLEWSRMGQAQKEAYLLRRGIVLRRPPNKPLPPPRNQAKPPQGRKANNQIPPMLQEKDAKKELGLLKIAKDKARLASQSAVRQEIAAGKLLVEAKATAEKVKPVFEAAQIKLRDSTTKETRQRKEFDGAKLKLDASISALNIVEVQIVQNRVRAWESCVRARKSLRDGYVKRKPELKNDPVPFVRD